MLKRIPNFDRDKISALAEAAGIETGPELVSAVEDLAAEYETWKRDASIPLTEVRQHLTTSKSSLETALRELVAAGTRTHAQLRGVYRPKYTRPSPKKDIPGVRHPILENAISDSLKHKPEKDIEAAKRLSNAIGALLDQLPQGGRPTTDPRGMLFVELAKLYEQRSRKRFQYPDKKHDFLGSDFVCGMAQIIDASISYEQCVRALKAGAEALRLERNLQKPL